VLAVLPDHPTPIRIKTHSREPVPFVIWGKEWDATTQFSEREAQKGSFGMKDAPEFLSFLFS
jgi:2,3-bisphosphoglycerate-independent phosphoglycerate mutase